MHPAVVLTSRPHANDNTSYASNISSVKRHYARMLPRLLILAAHATTLVSRFLGETSPRPAARSANPKDVSRDYRNRGICGVEACATHREGRKKRKCICPNKMLVIKIGNATGVARSRRRNWLRTPSGSRRVIGGDSLPAFCTRAPRAAARGLTFQFVDPLLHLLARLERDHDTSRGQRPCRRCGDCGPCGGPDASPRRRRSCAARCGRSATRASTIASKVFCTISFVLQLGQPDFFGDGPNDLFLGHDSILL